MIMSSLAAAASHVARLTLPQAATASPSTSSSTNTAYHSWAHDTRTSTCFSSAHCFLLPSSSSGGLHQQRLQHRLVGGSGTATTANGRFRMSSHESLFKRPCRLVVAAAGRPRGEPTAADQSADGPAGVHHGNYGASAGTNHYYHFPNNSLEKAASKYDYADHTRGTGAHYTVEGGSSAEDLADGRSAPPSSRTSVPAPTKKAPAAPAKTWRPNIDTKILRAYERQPLTVPTLGDLEATSKTFFALTEAALHSAMGVPTKRNEAGRQLGQERKKQSSRDRQGTRSEQKRRKTNPYLAGNFAPVDSEVTREERCEVIGEIPEGLRGRLLRNGPNPLYIEDRDAYHWFDGDGMVHNLRFADADDANNNSRTSSTTSTSSGGCALYSRRFVRTSGWKEEQIAQRSLHSGLRDATPGMKHLRVVALHLLHLRARDTPIWNLIKNVANNSLFMVGGKLLALWETGLPYEINPETLETMGVHHFGGKWSAGVTAHPKKDPDSNETMIYGYNLTHLPHLVYGVLNPQGEVIHSADIHLPDPVMMHDFAITPNFSLLLDFPLRFQLEKIVASGGKAKPFVFDDQKPARIGVIPRFGSDADIKWFKVEPGFCVHTLNAYEEFYESGNLEIVLLAFRFASFSALSLAELPPHLQSHEVCRLREYRLCMRTGSVKERDISPVCSDFPALNLNFLGKKTKFGFSSRFTNQPGPGNNIPQFDALLKHNFENGSIEVHSFGEGRFGEEAIFVPRASLNKLGDKSNGDDDGWLLVHVWDDDDVRSEVLVLDAKNFEGAPLARVIIPHRVPFGFHGMFLHA